MTFRVETTRKAKHDLDDILNWLVSADAGNAGLRWFQGLQDAVLSLSQLPGRCMVAPENKVFPFEVRQLLYGGRPYTYRILFTIQGDLVTVLHIRRGRRQPLGGR